MPGQDLLAQRQRREPVGVDLHDGRVVHALEQVPPVGSHSITRSRRSARECAASHPSRLRDLRLQGVLGAGSPCTRNRRAGGAGKAAEPAHDFAAVGVRRHRVDLLDPRAHRHRRARASSPRWRRRPAGGPACPPPGSRRTAPCCAGRAAPPPGGAARGRRWPCRSTRSRCALRWLAVSSFDCCGDATVWKRAVANAVTFLRRRPHVRGRARPRGPRRTAAPRWPSGCRRRPAARESASRPRAA